MSYIARYGLTVPYWDDWGLIPYAASRTPITVQWLWAFQGDHRIPLPKLIFVGLYRLGHGDLRLIMFANLAILVLIAGLGIIVARHRRGFTRWSDLIIPLTVAGIANYSNLVSANQIQYISSVGLFGLAVCSILWRPGWFRPATVALVGVCLVGLPLTGSTGVALALPLLGLLAMGAYLNHGAPDVETRRACWIAGLFGLTTLGILVAYSAFADRPASPVLSTASDLRQFVLGTLQFLAVGFTAPPLAGSSAGSEWVQRLWMVRSAVLVAALACAVAGLIWEVTRRRAPISSILGPLACLASVVALAIVIGLERGAALDQRYIILGATLVFTTYLCLSLVKRRIATVAGWALALTTLLLLPLNAAYAISFGEARKTFEADLVRDIRAGVPVDLLGTQYYSDIWGDPTLAAGAIREMRDDRIGPFADGSLQLNDAPPTIASEETLSTQPVAVHDMTQTGNYWQGNGAESYLLYAVGGRNVAGIRLVYRLTNTNARPAYLQLDWSRPEGGASKKFVVYGAAADDQQGQTVAWIGGPVDTLKVTPDTQAASFEVDSITLLLAP